MDTKTVCLRPLTRADLPAMYQWVYGEAHPEWKDWDAPYLILNPIPFELFEQRMRLYIPEHRAIEVAGEFIGVTVYNFEDKESGWVEAGIAIYNPEYWSKGYGTTALKEWVRELFLNSELGIQRISLHTWSGNERMIKAALKLGFSVEGVIRNARVVRGVYYDAVYLGMLKSEFV